MTFTQAAKCLIGRHQWFTPGHEWGAYAYCRRCQKTKWLR